ncbi:CoA pyrophosphatase [soil metagenome]
MIYFPTLLSGIHEKMKAGLPGDQAHQRMSPPHRLPASHYLNQAINYKEAAVMALIFPDANDGRARIIFIERTGGMDVHAHQISFPGGKKEPNDIDFLDTAIRETEEEIGVNKNLIIYTGALSKLYIPPSNFLVYPYVGMLDSQPDFILSTKEVKQVISPDLSLFLDPNNKKDAAFKSSQGYEVKAPYYQIGEFKIWGATAMMISELMEVIS